jgi:hypothetical protein
MRLLQLVCQLLKQVRVHGKLVVQLSVHHFAKVTILVTGLASLIACCTLSLLLNNWLLSESSLTLDLILILLIC